MYTIYLLNNHFHILHTQLSSAYTCLCLGPFPWGNEWLTGKYFIAGSIVKYLSYLSTLAWDRLSVNLSICACSGSLSQADSTHLLL